MANLTAAIRIIEGEIKAAEARVAIAHEGFPDESVFMATRDGYLNLAWTILAFVAQADSENVRTEEAMAAWGDAIKRVFYDLPIPSHVCVVSMQMLPDHTKLIAQLRQMVDPIIGYPLTNDPQFAEPNDSCQRSVTCRIP